jgi:hypothetical protein
MRLISDDVLELVAGGIQTVTVIGERLYDDPPPIWWDDPGYPDPGAAGSADGGGSAEPALPPCQVHSSPPPALTPQGVDLNALRNMVETASNDIGKMDSSVEHAVFFIRMPDGHVERSAVIHGDNYGFEASLSLNGGQIVAWIHSHPAEWGIDETIPSFPRSVSPDNTPDTTFAASIVASHAADPGALMYIRDNASGKTYEYTAAGPDAKRTQGADISSDHPHCGG